MWGSRDVAGLASASSVAYFIKKFKKKSNIKAKFDLRLMLRQEH
jgi:hypothetical protein